MSANTTVQTAAATRAENWRERCRVWREGAILAGESRGNCTSDAAWNFCAQHPSGDLHPGNLFTRLMALREEVDALCHYVEQAPDEGHPMYRLRNEPAFQEWFDRDDDTPPPALPWDESRELEGDK